MIHPCKTCVSTAMPLCHWPCSCYPNHALGQVQDWMNDIYADVGGRARRDDHLPGELVRTAVGPEADDRPPGLRRRRQSRSDLDPRQESSRPRSWSWPAGPIRSISPAACSRWSCMATTAARKRARRDLRLAARHRPDRSGPHVAACGARRLHAALRHQPRRLDRDTAFQEEVRNAARALVQAVKLMRRGRIASSRTRACSAHARSERCQERSARCAARLRNARERCGRRADGGPAASMPTGSRAPGLPLASRPFDARGCGSVSIWRSTMMTMMAPATSSIWVA